MKWAALIAWVITAGGGFVMLGLWLQGGGMRQTGADRTIRPPLILSHFALAAAGFTMLAIWLGQRRGAGSTATTGSAATTSVATGGGAPPAGPAERRFPVPVVVAHGLFAATTLVLVLLTATGVGD